MPPVPLPAEESEFVRRKIEELRQRLLDLTNRNPLLSFRHPIGSSVRIVDELPDRVVGALRAKKGLLFEPVPRPTEAQLAEHGYIKTDPETGSEVSRTKPSAEEWAKICGIQASYELPANTAATARHGDGTLQTLLFPDALEARLRLIRGRASGAETEMGCNILFLAVGFLEWYEAEHADLPRLAPLFTLPVDIARDRLNAKEGAFRYRLTQRDEDVLENITLREKLASDFALSLPSISEEEAPEEYFDKLRATVLKQQPRWKLHRFITLATFNFQKQAMYEDLAPARWSEDSLVQHPLVREFFVATERPAEEQAQVCEEYRIDELPNAVDRYPIVDDADSSQHSAIVDALEGRNLVIEGPPGTGKSQTITNLIAASIAAGKSVLFVAEKLAALDVVKARLDRAGLGDFCLELHGNKAQKSSILQAIAARIQRRYEAPNEIGVEKQLLESHRDTLNRHASRVNAEWKGTGKTPHAIFSAAVFHRGRNVTGVPLPSIPSLSGDKLTPLLEKQLLDKARRLAALHAKVAAQTPGATLASHYWCGLRKATLLQFGAHTCVAELEAWTAQLEGLSRFASCELVSAGFDQDLEWSATTLEHLRAACEGLPDLSGRERLESVALLGAHSVLCREALEANHRIHREWAALGDLLDPEALDDRGFAQKLTANANRLRPLGLPPSATLRSLTELQREMERAQAACELVDAAFDDIRARVPAPLQQCVQATKSGLREYLILTKLIRALPPALWRYRNPIFDNDDLDPLIEDLRARLGDLAAIRAQLKDVFDIARLPEADSLATDIDTLRAGGLFRILSKKWRAARTRLNSLVHAGKPAQKLAREMLPQLLRYARGIEEAEALNRDNPCLGSEYQGVETPIDRITEIRAWYRRVRAEYGTGFGRRAEIGDALFEVARDTAMAIAEHDAGELCERVEGLQAAIGRISLAVPGASLAQSSTEALSGADGSVNRVRTELAVFLSTTARLFISADITIPEARKLAVRWQENMDRLDQWPGDEAARILAQSGFALSKARKEPNLTEATALEDTLAIAESLNRDGALLSAFSKRADHGRYETLREVAKNLAPLVSAESEARGKFANAGDVDMEAWTEVCGQKVSGLIQRNRAALSHQPWMSDWLDYLRIKDSLLPEGLQEFIRYLEASRIGPEDIDSLTNAVINQQLANEILAEDPDLSKFYGPDQETVRTSFGASDRRVLQLKRSEIAASVSGRPVPHGKTGGKVGDYTDRALLVHEAQKKTRHIPLRDLLDRAGDALVALKPCFMMSPMSVATHLVPARHMFDLLIMDEASQIKPEDALGAIARARTLVIVGDPKQLPPTSFFDRVVEGAEESDDEVTLQESESILEAVRGIFPARRLRWHYRSRHESLIAFSADNFYDNDLVLFPSPFETNPDYGVKFHKVHDGFFQRVNQPEARAIVEFVLQQLLDRPQESVGVVAMSAQQCLLIEEEIERRMKDDAHVRRLIEEQSSRKEPLFFKNLESVQGDERDVIVISMTYGPITPGGKAPQRFGPINNTGGWRRLNVLFTRAKKRMHVFSSLSASDISEGGTLGRKALHGFLAYCERLPGTDGIASNREPANDFERSVAAALEARGYGCTPQLGVAGYFLDIAVRDPFDPGRYLLGVECDGATYHAAKSARDRDRLRQEILEGLGWTLVRIWSTDWFKNPELQLQKVMNALKEREASHRAF